MPKPVAAIAPFLASCPAVLTLGVRAAIADYSPAERELLASARRIFFPTPRFAKIFEAAGKNVFPSGFTYGLRKSRLVQETFFQLCGIEQPGGIAPLPHPRTRIYFGRQKEAILSDFSFPFTVMGPSASDGPQVVADTARLSVEARKHNPLIAQEVCAVEDRFLLVFVNCRRVAAIGKEPGGSLTRFSDPAAAAAGAGLDDFSEHLSRLLRFFRIDDIGVDVFRGPDGTWRAGSMSSPPVRWQTPEGTFHRHRYIAGLIEKEEI